MKNKHLTFVLAMLMSMAVCSMTLVSCGDDEPVPEEDDSDVEVESYRRAVDLGLPSRTLWANMNVGASSNLDYGDYFAWGETSPKDYYDWTTYKWCKGFYDTLTKYCNYSSEGYNGFTDNKTELDLKDDAAYVNWGSNWRMPSLDQLEELDDKCTWKWTSVNKINGYLVTGPNGNSIFLPAAGYRSATSLLGVGRNGTYWMRTLDKQNNQWSLKFTNDVVTWLGGSGSRYYGKSVRPVRNQ